MDLQTQLLSNGDSDRFQSAHVAFSTYIAYGPIQLILNLLGGGGVVDPLRGCGAWVLIGETVPSDTHMARHHTRQKVHYLIAKENKVLWSMEGKFPLGNDTLEYLEVTWMWRLGTLLLAGGDFLGVFEKPGRYCWIGGGLKVRSTYSLRDYGWKLQRTLRPGGACVQDHPNPRLMPPSSHSRSPPVTRAPPRINLHETGGLSSAPTQGKDHTGPIFWILDKIYKK